MGKKTKKKKAARTLLPSYKFVKRKTTKRRWVSGKRKKKTQKGKEKTEKTEEVILLSLTTEILWEGWVVTSRYSNLNCLFPDTDKREMAILKIDVPCYLNITYVVKKAYI